MKIRQRGNYEEQDGDYSDSFITDTLLYDFIDSANCELYDRLIAADSDAAPVAEYQFSAAAATSSLPADFYKARAVDVLSGGSWLPVGRYSLHERGAYQREQGTTVPLYGTSYAYRVEGKLGGEMQLRIVPDPAASPTLRVTYVPLPTKLTTSSQTVDGVNGYEELLVLYALRRCQAREGVATAATDAEIARQEQRISSAASRRDGGLPMRLHGRHDRSWRGVR